MVHSSSRLDKRTAEIGELCIEAWLEPRRQAKGIGGFVSVRIYASQRAMLWHGWRTATEKAEEIYVTDVSATGSGWW